MIWMRRFSLARTLLAVSALSFAGTAHVSAADALTWRKDKDSVDADVTGWSLMRVLETIAAATGWQVYLEPGTRAKVSTKFKERPKDRALDLLLNNLGRVLLPGTNGGPPRLLVFRNSQKDATRLIRGWGKGAKPIANELIVTLKPGKNMEDVAKELGAKIIGRNKDLNSARLRFEDEDAANKARDNLLENDDVASVDPNFPILNQPVPQSSANAAPAINMPPLKDGEGVTIAFLDTAVQAQGTGLEKYILPEISVTGEAEPTSDSPTHGTAMVEAAAIGATKLGPCDGATGVRFQPIPVFPMQGETTTWEVAEGINRALQTQSAVINMSLGSEGNTPYMENAINRGLAAGRKFVASAGNSPVTTPTYPAAYNGVIAVTAGEAQGKLAPYANRGDFVDIMAPGNALIQFNGQSYRVSGTSPAAAFISGALAAQMDCGGLSSAEATALLQRLLPVPQP